MPALEQTVLREIGQKRQQREYLEMPLGAKKKEIAPADQFSAEFAKSCPLIAIRWQKGRTQGRKISLLSLDFLMMNANTCAGHTLNANDSKEPNMPTTAETKGRRVTIDLTPAATEEVDRLRALTGLTTADVFRHALSLFRIYVDGKRSGNEMELVPRKADAPNTRIELPVTIQKSGGGR